MANSRIGDTRVDEFRCDVDNAIIERHVTSTNSRTEHRRAQRLRHAHEEVTRCRVFSCGLKCTGDSAGTPLVSNDSVPHDAQSVAIGATKMFRKRLSGISVDGRHEDVVEIGRLLGQPMDPFRTISNWLGRGKVSDAPERLAVVRGRQPVLERNGVDGPDTRWKP